MYKQLMNDISKCDIKVDSFKERLGTQKHDWAHVCNPGR